MNLSEFKAWFDGYTTDKTHITKDQLKVIKEKMATVVDPYWNPYQIWYPTIVYPNWNTPVTGGVISTEPKWYVTYGTSTEMPGSNSLEYLESSTTWFLPSAVE